MNLTGFMNFTGQFKNTFGGGGFARINVSENTNISVLG